MLILLVRVGKWQQNLKENSIEYERTLIFALSNEQ